MEYQSINSAADLLSKGEISAALEVARSVIKRRAAEVDQTIKFCDKLKAASLFRESIEFFDYCIELEPNNIDVLSRKARACHACGERLSAQLETEKILALVRNDTIGLATLVQLYVDIDKFVFAEELCGRILKVDAENIAIKKLLVTALLSRHKYDEAKSVLDGLASSKSLLNSDWLFLARSYSRTKSHDAALRAAIKAAEHCEPPGIQEHLFLIDKLLLSGNKKEASAKLDKISDKLVDDWQFAKCCELFLSCGRKSNAEAIAQTFKKRALDGQLSESLIVRTSKLFALLKDKSSVRELLALIDIANIREKYMVRDFHDAAFEVELYELARKSAKRGIELESFFKHYNERLGLLSILRMT
jgi:tetratricopeptide (TPR) repeat protein